MLITDKKLESYIKPNRIKLINQLNPSNYKLSWGKSVLSALIILIPFLTLITLVINLSEKNLGINIIIYIFLGIYFHKISILLHDLSHLSFFPKRNVNIIIGNIVAWICFTDYKSYQTSHMKHHSRTGDKEDLEITEVFKNGSSKEIKIYLLKNLIGLNILNDNKYRIKFSSWLSFAGMITTQAIIFKLISSNSENFYMGFMWFISSTTIGLFLSRLRGLLEHCSIDNNGTILTRSHYCNKLEDFIFYSNNMNYHVEHHLFPNLPTYHLKDVSNSLNRFLLKKYTSNSPIKTLFNLLNRYD